MRYNFNGKEINIPDAEIANSVKLLGISQQEAIEMWLDDNDYTTNEEVETLTEKAKEVKRYEKSDKPRTKTEKTRKVDSEKKTLLDTLMDAIRPRANITTVKNEAEFSFTLGANKYTVKLVKHRPPKK